MMESERKRSRTNGIFLLFEWVDKTGKMEIVLLWSTKINFFFNIFEMSGNDCGFFYSIFILSLKIK